jgi:predicted porin
VFTEAYDIGIEGPFGKFEMGKINPTAERLVPGGSLDAALGSNDAAPTSDPHANGLRYETNSINGFEFGVSARMEDQTGDDDTVDDWSIAAKYTLPLGLEAGVAYETKTCFEDGGATNNCDAAASGLDDASGWRFGARYGQDNYLLAYEYRTYENFGAWDTNSRQRDSAAGATTTNVDVDRDFDSLLEYNVHRVAIQATVDRVTLSANYSIAETEVNGYGSDVPVATVDAAVPKRTFDETALGVDASYALGSRSFIIIGYKTVETEVLGRNATTDAAGNTQAEADAVVAGDPTLSFDENTFLLRYRIDF